MVESSFESMLGVKEETSFEDMVGRDSSFEDMLGIEAKEVEDPSLIYEVTPPTEPKHALQSQLEALQSQRTEVGLMETDPLITHDMKKGFMETLSGYGHLATHPYEVLQGAVDFVSSIPGFLTGVGIAGQRMAKNTLDQITLAKPLDVFEKDFPYIDPSEVFSLEKLYNAASEGMTEGMEFFEPGKEALFGKAPEASHLVGATVMAPLLAANKAAGMLAGWEGFENSPNIRGALKFSGDIGGFLALGYLHRGPRPDLTKKVESVSRKATDIKMKADIIAKTPDEAMRKAQERVLEVQKVQVELEAKALKEEIKEGIDLEQPIKEDLKVKGEKVKKTKVEISEITKELMKRRKEADERLAKAEEKPLVGEEPEPQYTGKTEEFKEFRRGDPDGPKKIFYEVKVDGKKKFISKPPVKVEPTIQLEDGEVSKFRIKEAKEGDVWGASDTVKEGYIEGYFPDTKEWGGVSGVAIPKGTETAWQAAEKRLAEFEGMLSGKITKLPIKEPKAIGRLRDIFTEVKDKKVEDRRKGIKPVEPITELDRQTGTKTPPSIEGESNPFFQTPEQAEGFRKVFEGRKIEDVEVATQKVINDVNLAYHAGDEAGLLAARDALSDLAVRGDELRMQFIKGKNHLEWKETVSNAAEWARGLRLEIQQGGEGPKLYSGIPVDEILKTSKNFKQWFGKSKVKDIVYHGSPKRFVEFDPNKRYGGIGIHFGTREQARNRMKETVKSAIDFEDPVKATLFKGYLKLENPVRFDHDPMIWDIETVVNYIFGDNMEGKFPKTLERIVSLRDKYEEGNIHVYEATKQLEKLFKEEGYDGFVYPNEVEGKGDSYAVFDSSQFKDVRNIGTFIGDIGNVFHTGLPLDEMQKAIIKMADKAITAGKKAREFKKFKPLETTKLVNEKYKRNFVDRSGNIRLDFLRKLDDVGYKIIQRMYLTKGADPLSTMELHQMRKELSSGLTRNEKRVKDDVIFNTRMADIAGYKLPKDFKFPEGSSPTESAAYLELWAQREKIPIDRAEKIQASVDGYFEWMKKKLDDMEAEGLITAQEKADLAAHKYSKLKLVDILDRENELTIGGKKRSVHDSGIEPLAKGRETDILERDSEILALEHFERINGRILHNRANNLLYDLAINDPKNPFVRVRKPNEGIPKGWQKIFVYKEGVRETIHISPEMAKEWVTSNPEITYKTGQFMKYVSASPMLKTFATGIEWAFALRNVPRDVMHIYYAARVFENGKWKSVYSDHLPVFLPQIALDIARVFPDVVTKGKNLQAYYGRGGGMEFLTSGGLLLRRGRRLESNIGNMQKALSRFGQISELTTRRAIEEHVMRKRAKEKGISIEEARKDRDIMDEATFAAIDYMHFSQGGGIAKAIDNGVPYLNARIQASRGLWRVAKENPGTFIYKTAQLMALTTTLYHAMRVQTPLTTEALQGSSDLRNNYCIPVGDDYSFVDEKGQTRYWGFKIPIDPAQKFFKGLTEAIYDKTVGNEIDVEEVIKNLGELSPVESAPLFPTVTGTLEYTQNKDYWMGDDAWKMTDPFPWSTVDEDGNWVGSSKEFTLRTPEALKDIGEVTRLSPERMKTAAGELVTENSTWFYLLGKGYDELFKDVPKEEKQKQWQMILKDFPITGSFFFVTNPYTKHAGDIEKDVNVVALKRLNERTELDRLTDGYLFQKSIERGEVMSYIRSFKDPRTRERLQDRFDFQYAIRSLEERSFWMRLQHLDPEIRAKQYHKATKTWDSETLAHDRRVIGTAGGFFSDSFWTELNKIRRGDEGEE